MKLEEIEAIKLAEQGKVDDAIEAISKLISTAPETCQPSLHNNRAQMYVIRREFALAMADMDSCIRLASADIKRYRKLLSEVFHMKLTPIQKTLSHDLFDMNVGILCKSNDTNTITTVTFK